MHPKYPLLIHVEDPELLPTYATPYASGADLRASTGIVIPPGESRLVPTGVRLEISPGYEVQIRPRSGLAAKNQLTVLNAPGTIDADYRGEIMVILINHGKEPFVVLPKMRIAQMVLAPVVQAEFSEKGSLSETKRGAQGFGHTGTH